MKKFLLLLLSIGSISGLYSQCGPITNPTFSYTNDYVWDWDDVAAADFFIIQFTEPNSGWAYLIHEDTVTTSEYVFPAGCNQEYSADWRVITRCGSQADTSATFTFQLTCSPPTVLSTINVTTNSALLVWNQVPNFSNACNHYVASYRPLGSSNWIGLGYIDSTSFQLNNLQSNTIYEWCVNQVCFGEVSPPSLSQFTTSAPPCLTTTTTNVLELTNTSVKLNWALVPGAQNFRIRYKEVAATTWNSFDTPFANTQYVLTGLTPNTSYEYQVATICSTNNISTYSAPFTFTTNCVSLNNSVEYIRFVQIKDKIRVSTQDPNGYAAWNDPAVMVVGQSYTVKIAGGGAINTSNKQNVAAFLDMNKNGIFEAAERVIGVGMLHNTSAKSYSFTVPAAAQAGITKMRIVMLKQSQGLISPCPPVGWRGEVEDYYVSILNPPASLLGSIPAQDYNNALTSIEMDDEASSSPIFAENTSETSINITVRPNPASQRIVVDVDNLALTELTVYTSTGQVVKKITHSFNEDIPIEEMAPGLYYVVAKALDGKRHTTKFIKI